MLHSYNVIFFFGCKKPALRFEAINKKTEQNFKPALLSLVEIEDMMRSFKILVPQFNNKYNK